MTATFHPTFHSGKVAQLFRVIAYSTGSSNGEASCSTSVLIPHQVAHLGMSLLGPEFRRDHRAPFFYKCYFAAVVTLYLAIGDVLEDLCTEGLTEKIKTSTMMFDILWYSSCGVEGLTEESCMVAEIMALLRVAWCPRSGPDLLNQFALEGWSRVFRVLGPRHFEGVRRGIPGPTPSLVGQHPQNWPPLDGMSLPSEKTSVTLLWNTHRGKVKGEREVEFLPACGAAQEKQLAAALPLPGFLVWVSLAAGHNGHHPKNWLSGTPLYSPLYSQGRCLRRAHCGLLRAGTGAGPDICLALSPSTLPVKTSTLSLRTARNVKRQPVACVRRVKRRQGQSVPPAVGEQHCGQLTERCPSPVIHAATAGSKDLVGLTDQPSVGMRRHWTRNISKLIAIRAIDE